MNSFGIDGVIGCGFTIDVYYCSEMFCMWGCILPGTVTCVVPYMGGDISLLGLFVSKLHAEDVNVGMVV